jgi:hypothetical protein
MKISSVMIGLLLAATLAFGDSRPPLLIAYFIPSDREAIPGYPQRLDAVMTELQRFYRDGMQAAGYGPATFRLERDAGGALAVHVVRGKQPMRSYGRNDSDKVRGEVDAALRAQDIRAAGKKMVIFQVLLPWDRGVAVEVGPYVGGGNHRELFRSDRIDRPMMHRAELPIEGLRRLELLVEDAGDGPGRDWGVWLEPALTR